MSEGIAQLVYESGHYQILTPGTYVICAVTGKHIPLSELRYWSHERQEAYADAEAATRRHQAAGEG